MNYLFQIDVEDPSTRLLFYRLRDMFKNADLENTAQTLESFKHIMGSTNVVDHGEPINSPYRNRPAFLDDSEIKFQHGGTMKRPLPPKKQL